MVERAILAQFGGIDLLRVFCVDCDGWALVTGFGRKSCCEAEVGEIEVEGSERVDPGKGGPRLWNKLSKSVKHVQLEAQGWCCAYCCLPFHLCEVFDRVRGKYWKPTPVWDHFVPYAFAKSHKVPFVAACRVCNASKFSHMFRTILEARTYIEESWTKRYELIRVLEGAPVSSAIKPFNPEGRLKDFAVQRAGPLFTPAEQEKP